MAATGAIEPSGSGELSAYSCPPQPTLLAVRPGCGGLA